MKITYEIYQDMQKRFDQYVKDNNKDPEKIYLPDKSNFIYTNDLIALSKVKYEEFPVDYSNTNTSSPLPAPANKSNLDKLRDKFGYFDTICGFYDNIVRKCSYSYYYNQANSAQGMVDLLLRNGTLSVNCTDWSVLTCYIAKELGYPFRVYNVVCSQGAGHVRCSIIDKNDPGDWISTDPAAIADQSDRRYNCINDVWCDTNNGSRIVDTSDKNCLLGWMHW